MLNFLLQLPIIFYIKAIKPWKRPCCRFSPSCSAYAMESLQKHSAMNAIWLIAKRILRCHPFNRKPHQYDPVPLKKTR